MKRLIFSVLAIGVVAGGWFLVSPLFIDRAVDEGLDFLNADGQIDMQGIMALPEDRRLNVMPDIMAVAAAMPDKAASDGMPEGTPAVIAEGEFVDADAVHKGSGDAILYALPDGRHVVRFENFRTTNGPDLVVYLVRHTAPATDDDVVDSGFLSIGKLKGNVGNQNYVIPASTDISDYNSVVIWCELFGVLFSPASLQAIRPSES